MAEKIRVIVVDDSALVRGLLAEIIDRQPDMCCIGAAADPLVAREMIRNLNPDVITLDVEMPRMDGIDFLSRLMRLRPMPVVMVSTLTERGADVTLKALELGAVDFVSKPKIGVSDGLRQLGADITEKIRTAARARVHRLANVWPRPLRPAQPRPSPCRWRRWAACPRRRSSSSARPPAAPKPRARCWSACRPTVPAVMITQHMPPGFTKSYAARLNGLCPHSCGRGQRRRTCAARACLHRSGRLPSVAWSARVPITSPACRPASRSTATCRAWKCCSTRAARLVGRNALGVMLTGMGADGARAMRTMRDAGSYNVVQDEASLRGVRHAARGHRPRRHPRSAAAQADRAAPGGLAAQQRRRGHLARLEAFARGQCRPEPTVRRHGLAAALGAHRPRRKSRYAMPCRPGRSGRCIPMSRRVASPSPSIASHARRLASTRR
jgi:two-component system chemotaxis response regulator CheB